MHSLHFLLVNAGNAEEAASESESLVLGWGDDNNWFSVGGVASEEGGDDVENHADGSWGLSFLDDCTPQVGTYFNRALAYLHRAIDDPVTLPFEPCSTHPDLRSACAALGDRLRAFDPEDDSPLDLREIELNTRYVSNVLDSRRTAGTDIPEFFGWRFDEFGLTDMTDQTEGARRYIVFLDMHC